MRISYFFREKWLNSLQTVETLIRRCILQRLIWVCIVWWVPFYRSPDYNGLNTSFWVFIDCLGLSIWIHYMRVKQYCRIYTGLPEPSLRTCKYSMVLLFAIWQLNVNVLSTTNNKQPYNYKTKLNVKQVLPKFKLQKLEHVQLGKFTHLNLALLNLDRQCRSRSVGFWRSQLIWICTVCHKIYISVSTTCIK